MANSKMLAGGLALVIGLFAIQTSRAEIVYTTAASQGGASNIAVSSPSNSTGYLIGSFGNTTTTPSFSFTTANKNQLLPGIKFTTSTFSDIRFLQGVNVNLFVKGSSGNTPNTINAGTLSWDLYKVVGTTATNEASFTSSLNSMSYTGSGYSVNNYQNTAFNLSAGANTLLSNTQYTLLLKSINGINTIGSANNAELYWNFYNTGNTPSGGAYSVQNAGYVTEPYSGTSSFTNQNFAFDIQVASAPEPGTLLLGLIASSVGGGAVWWRRRKKLADQVADENVLPA